MKSMYYTLTITGLLLFAACQKTDDHQPVTSCSDSAIQANPNFPNADRLQGLLEKYVKRGFPGVTMMIKHPDHGTWVGSAGYSSLEEKTPMQPCNLFFSASVAKTYHVVAALQLAEEGKLDIRAPIDQYLPDWVCSNLPNHKEAKVVHLMNHTSGIPDFVENIYHITDYYNNVKRTFTQQEYLDYLCGKKPDFEPGKGVFYSNTNTLLLALILDEVSGDHAQLISDKIIKPLGLKNTYYKREAGYPNPPGLVNTYADFRGNGLLSNSTEVERLFNIHNIGHDGMLVSPHDFLVFIDALAHGQLVKKTTLEQMIRAVNYSPGFDIGEGLGLHVVRSELSDLTRFGHTGGSLGAANSVFHYKEKDVSIVICANFGGFVTTHLGQSFYGSYLGDKNTLIGETEVLLFGK